MFTLFLCMTLSMVEVYQDIPVKFSTCPELRSGCPGKVLAVHDAASSKKIY